MPKNFLNSARISDDHLAIALAQVKLGFWEFDLKTELIECTHQNRLNFGFSQNQIITEQIILDAILPEDRWRRTEGVRRAMNPETPTYDFEIRVKHPDEKICWLQVRGTVIFEEMKALRIIGSTVDISERKGVEVLRDELLSVTTHELKTPLSVVKGYLQVLHKFISSLGDQRHQLIAERAMTASGKVERLLDDITNPELHQASEMILRKDRVDLRKLVSEVIANASLINTGIEIQFNTQLDLPAIEADRYRIAQVVTNLINNAIKYAPGENLIEIGIQVDAAEVVVSITDKGIGIPDTERNKIFEKFYRIDGSKTVATGSGIGLFLCAEIIIRHGGKIGMKSNPAGKGTVASFSLPR